MEEIAPGLYCWSAPHPQWAPEDLEGGQGWEQTVSSYALAADDGLVLFDPLVDTSGWEDITRLVESAGPPAILITIMWHARSSQEILDRYEGATLWAHEPAKDWIGERTRITHTFLPGDDLPGGVEAIPMRRIEEVAFLLPGHDAVVIGDTILRHGDRAELCPPTWKREAEDFAAAEEAVRGLVERAPGRLLLTHGGPVGLDALRLES